MNYNIQKNKNLNYLFIQSLKKFNIPKTEKNAFFCSSKTSGKYSIDFVNCNIVKYFNKVNTSIILQNCPYYPKSYIFMNTTQYNNCHLEKKYYFVKPKFGGRSKNISYFIEKTPIIKNELKFPLIFQEEIQNIKKINDHRSDLRIHVIYIKSKEGINAYYYNDIIQRTTFKKDGEKNADSIFTNVSNSKKLNESILSNYENQELLKTLINANQYIINEMEKKEKRYKELEFQIVGYDIMVDQNDKHWILEINAAPSLFYPEKIQKIIRKMVDEILAIIVYYNKYNIIKTKKFVKII